MQPAEREVAARAEKMLPISAVLLPHPNTVVTEMHNPDTILSTPALHSALLLPSFPGSYVLILEGFCINCLISSQ